MKSLQNQILKFRPCITSTNQFSNSSSFSYSLLSSFSFCNGSSSSSTAINWNISLYLMELFNVKEFVQKSTLRDLASKVFLCYLLKTRCDVNLKLAIIRWEQERPNDRREMGMGQFLSLFQENFPVGLKEMRK